MFHVALFEPEIPPNTGNVIRLCANTGASLHLIKPLGFTLDNKRMLRAGLDHREFVDLKVHQCLADFTHYHQPRRLLAFSTRGSRLYTEVTYRQDDVLLFGPETRGLPDALLQALPADQVIKVPVLPRSRSLNLANTVSVALYEAWRQLGFIGGV